MKKPKIRLDLIKCLYIVTAVVGCVMIVKGMMLQPAISANAERTAKLSEQIEYENQRIKEIDALTLQADTDEYIEKIAREKLGMIKSDEIVFVDISGQ